jgi:hypothetical protein
LLNKLYNNPKVLFLIDGIGAMLSAISLGIVLPKFQDLLGIPVQILYFLATFPILFLTYDFYNFFNQNVNISKELKGIALLNLLYSVLSIGLAIYHLEVFKKLGWTYIILEVFILFFLSYLQLHTAKKITNRNN